MLRELVRRRLLTDDKAELITRLSEEDGSCRTLLELIAAAKKDANLLTEMMDSAEARLVAALANAEIKPPRSTSFHLM
jgi:hypothetical protein